MDFTEFSTSLKQALNLTDPGGVALVDSFLPRIIEYASLRILREFDFLATRTTDATALSTNGVRSVAIPPQFIVVEAASIIFPANTKPADAGANRIPMIHTSLEFINMTWPNESQVKTPSQLSDIYFSLFNEEVAADSDTSEPMSLPSSIQIAPTPDDAYHVEFNGTQRPAMLSADNPTTFLSVYVPDLFLAAAMIAGHGYLLRNWSGMADDPQAPMTFEKQYRILAEGVDIEELRKKSMSVGTTPFIPTPLTGVSRHGGGGAPSGGPSGPVMQQAG